jgi:hypothetical protein
MSQEVSILDDEKKEALNNLGTNAAASLTGSISSIASQLPATVQTMLCVQREQWPLQARDYHILCIRAISEQKWRKRQFWLQLP